MFTTALQVLTNMYEQDLSPCHVVGPYYVVNLYFVFVKKYV